MSLSYYADTSQLASEDPEVLTETTCPKEQLDGKGPAAESLVIRPSHYSKWPIEPITFVMKNGLDYARGNVIKYVVRAGSKLYDGMDAKQSEITDLKKARRYIDMLINHIEGKDTL